MASPVLTLTIFFCLVTLLITATAYEDRPHGLADEIPAAISPEAYAFFHPNAIQPPSLTVSSCDRSSNCTSMPLAAQVRRDDNSVSGSAQNRGLRGSAIAGICLGSFAVCVVGVGVLYVVNKRRENLRRAKQSLEVV